jgi:hypothetical protein
VEGETAPVAAVFIGRALGSGLELSSNFPISRSRSLSDLSLRRIMEITLSKNSIAARIICASLVNFQQAGFQLIEIFECQAPVFFCCGSQLIYDRMINRRRIRPRLASKSFEKRLNLVEH